MTAKNLAMTAKNLAITAKKLAMSAKNLAMSTKIICSCYINPLAATANFFPVAFPST